MRSKVYFADENIKKAYESLKNSKFEEQLLYKWISRAIDDLENNAFCGVQVHKKLIPKIYFDKYGIDNLWKYDLPSGWRLIYSVAKEKIFVVSLILEWMDHKTYEKRFGY